MRNPETGPESKERGDLSPESCLVDEIGAIMDGIKTGEPSSVLIREREMPGAMTESFIACRACSVACDIVRNDAWEILSLDPMDGRPDLYECPRADV